MKCYSNKDAYRHSSRNLREAERIPDSSDRNPRSQGSAPARSQPPATQNPPQNASAKGGSKWEWISRRSKFARLERLDSGSIFPEGWRERQRLGSKLHLPQLPGSGERREREGGWPGKRTRQGSATCLRPLTSLSFSVAAGPASPDRGSVAGDCSCSSPAVGGPWPFTPKGPGPW